MSSARFDAMDLDEPTGFGGRWPDYQAGGAPVHPAANLPIALTRYRDLERIVPTMQPLELLIMLLFFRAPATPTNLARFADLGITFFSYRATRFFETLFMSSLLLMRRGGETVLTIMTPLQVWIRSVADP